MIYCIYIRINKASLYNCRIIYKQMRTRAQRKIEEQTNPVKTQPAGPKKTKKELLQEKNEQLNKAAAGKADGKKKVKEEPVPAQRSRRSKQEKVRVVEQKSSPKKARGREKSTTVNKKEEQKKQASVQKKADETKKPRKKVNEPAKDLAKLAEQPKTKIAAKDGLNTEPEQQKQEIKTIQYKGKAPIDEHCTLKATNHHILQYNGKVYSATLNQTSLANNNNKYYILQIVQSDSNPSICYFFTRWGRVGVKGQISNIGPMTIPSAIRQYESKYHEKSRKGNYKEVQLNFQIDDKKKSDDKDDKPSSQIKKDESKIFSESKLQESVKRLIQLIFDVNMMKKQMIQIGYNVKKMPLGQLTERHIQKGFTILKKLMDQIKGKCIKQNLVEFSSQFYTTIPHDFGFSKMINFSLDTEQKVKQKIQMLEALSEIKVATALIDDKKQSENQLDSNFKKLQRDVTAINKDTTQFQLINRYLQSTHASTHTSYGLQLVDLFSLSNQAENMRYTKDIDNKMLLWHGSRLTNFVGILSQGLRIAPPQAPVTGYMFGKGVYFADMSSKSANYCFTSRESSTGILLLCEVALGGMNEKYHADYYAGNLPPGKHSTKGVGRTAPNPDNAVKLDDGVVIPMGPGEPSALACSLLYNEFIVYDIAQIKIRYLLRTRFNYR